MISGMDINPEGKLIATIDTAGVCLISDLENQDYMYHHLLQYSAGKPFGSVIYNLPIYIQNAVVDADGAH